MDSSELKSRTKSLAIGAVKLVERLERGYSSEVIGKQLLRSATSVAANYRSACRARSKADFVNKLGIVEEEVDETLFWFEMLGDCGKAKPEDITPLINETEQLLRIFSASRITAKLHLEKR